MKRLYVLRHAKSDWSFTKLSDFERPLNARGKQNAPYAAKILKDKAVMLDCVVSSPAVRALTTAEMVADALDYPSDKIRQEHKIYNAHVETLISLVEHLDDEHGSVMLVGHNPGVTRLVNYFVHDVAARLATCSVLAIEFDVDTWQAVAENSGNCLFFESPPHDL